MTDLTRSSGKGNLGSLEPEQEVMRLEFYRPQTLTKNLARESDKRFKSKLREAFRRGRGRKLRSLLAELRPKLIGWISYFRKSQVRGVFKDLDSWIRRKLRALQ